MPALAGKNADVIHISETMDLQLFFLHNANFHKKLTDVLPLVTLKLNNLTVLWMLNHSTITGKFLLKSFYKFFFVVIICNTLYSGQSLSAVSLLNSYMDIIFSPCRE